MWAFKSIVILIDGVQPDYWFELALVWFGLSILLLGYALRHRLRRSLLVPAVAGLAAGAGAAASAFYLLDGDDDGLFGPMAFVMMLSTVVFLFLAGGQIRRERLFGTYDFGPQLLAWLYVVAIPAGAALAALHGERYLGLALLAVVAGWLILSAGVLFPAPEVRSGSSDSSAGGTSG